MNMLQDLLQDAVQKVRLGLSPQGGGSRFTLETLKGSDDTIKAIEFATLESAKEVDKLSKEMIDPINTFLQKQAVDKKFTPVTQNKVLERIQDILEGKVNKKFVGPMPGNKKDLLLRGDRAEQALAKIKISKGQQQLLSKVPEIQNSNKTY
jgi:hypothetical protein